MKKDKEEKRVVLAVIADAHIGNFAAHGGEEKAGLNERCQLCLRSLRAAVKKAIEKKASMLVVAGDLFDKRRPEPAVIAAVQRVFADEAGDLPVLLIPGNHDMLEAQATEGNTACEPLYQVATVVREPGWYGIGGAYQVLAVPYNSVKPMREHLAEVLKQRVLRNSLGILVTHVGVYDDKSPPWCKGAGDAIHVQDLMELMEETHYEAAFVGNFHQHHVWGGKTEKVDEPLIVQVGALCPTGHADAGFYPFVGGLSLYDGEKHWMEEIPGPRFYTHLAKGEPGTVVEGESTIEIGGPLVSHSEIEQAIGNHLFVREAPVKEVAVELPEQARSAEEAIEAHVNAMKLPEGVQTSEVLKTTLRFWKGAA